MKKLPIKTQQKPEPTPAPAPKGKRLPKPTLDSLKQMDNAEKIELCKRLGLNIPHYEEGAKDHVIHMHLLHILKLHFGYAEDKPRNAGRKPTKTTTLTIHESNAELKKISAKLDHLTALVEKLLK